MRMLSIKIGRLEGHRCPLWVKADICGALARVRFTPNSDRESGFRHFQKQTFFDTGDMPALIHKAHSEARP